MSDQIPGAGARWYERDEDDVVYYLREAEGDLGACSSHSAMVDLAMSGIPQGGNISQKTFASMRLHSPVAREAKVRATMRAIGRDHARVLARYYEPRLSPKVKGGSDKPYDEKTDGPRPSALVLALEARAVLEASHLARLDRLAVLTHAANGRYTVALLLAEQEAIESLGRHHMPNELRTRALWANPHLASVEAWLADLRHKAAAGPGKREAAFVLADVGEASRALLLAAQRAYAMARKAYVEPWRPSPRAAAFQAMMGGG